MRLGVVVTDFPVLSETFVTREVLGLCAIGFDVYVYAGAVHTDPLVRRPTHANLTVREIPFLGADALVRTARDDGIDHLHSSLMAAAHRAAFEAARALDITFTARVLSGHDVFTGRDAGYYREASAHPLCAGFIVEDPLMADWLTSNFAVPLAAMRTVANGVDVEMFRPRRRRRRHVVTVLAIARFVEKKGLLPLVEAFREMASTRPHVSLRLLGAGPQEPVLRNAAAGHPRIEFLGPRGTADTIAQYGDADVFCLPCVRTENGDADGVPTTVLEAMACGLPVVTSDLLSAPYYVRHMQEGMLVAPGDVHGLAAALGTLCDDRRLRARLGTNARRRAEGIL
jgi:glycosyltransferase involved in cell wall biosynthesis